MKTEIQNLVILVKRTFEKGAWHGPSVLESLEGVTEQQALKRLPNTHNIIELVAHMAVWKTFTMKKLNGDAGYRVTDELNFPKTAGWPETLNQLRESQEQLLLALQAFPGEKLGEEFPGTTGGHTFYTLVHGIIHHDLYHAGQIMLIKKATVTQTI